MISLKNRKKYGLALPLPEFMTNPIRTKEMILLFGDNMKITLIKKCLTSGF